MNDIFSENVGEESIKSGIYIYNINNNFEHLNNSSYFGNSFSQHHLNKKRKRINDDTNNNSNLNSINTFIINENAKEKSKEYEINNIKINQSNNIEPNNNYLYIGCEDGTVKLIELTNESKTKKLLNYK